MNPVKTQAHKKFVRQERVFTTRFFKVAFDFQNNKKPQLSIYSRTIQLLYRGWFRYFL